MMENIIEEFNGIKFMKSVSSSTSEQTNLYKVFLAIISKSSLEIDQLQLQQIISNDLWIDKTSISRQLLAVLVEALMYYIIRWPGWQRQSEYQKGTLNAQDWFSRFQQYLIFKSKFIIKTARQEPSPEYEDKAIQTEIPKQMAPYRINIGAPAFVLNNVVFEERNGNILLRRCMEKAWKEPVLKELLHWPHVCVSLKLPDISISRSNIQHVHGYMGLCTDMEEPLETDHIIHVKKVSCKDGTNTNYNMTPYSLEYFSHYVAQLIKTLAMIPGVFANRLLEIESVLQEFLNDISEANIYDKTMCTCISVRYNIGKFTYMRNRKMIVASENRLSKNQNAVNYFEQVVPQMDFTLYEFNAVQDPSDVHGISFVSLNSIKHKLKKKRNLSEIEQLKDLINSSCLMYSCTSCQKQMHGDEARTNLIQHLKIEHRAEQSLLCYKCCKEFEIYNLANNRYVHNCSNLNIV